MARSFPPDVIVLDTDSLIHARFGRGSKKPQLVQAKSYRILGDAFTPGVVTPELTNEAALTDVLRRLRAESGRWERLSLLLPDSWFRMNILELPSLPSKTGEANDVVRWSLKRTLPIAPEELRIAYQALGAAAATGAVKLLVVSALEKTLAAIEAAFAANGFEVVLVEPVGLNIWNAVAVREAATANDRVFLYVRDKDFTTAVFRGTQPLFIRSRNLSGERSLHQEIRLSASYLRDTLQATAFENCYIAGAAVDAELRTALEEAFSAPVRSVSLKDVVDGIPPGVAGMDAELTACTGVFTG
jgi:Tfp pilus assembly PilM family ATPase